MEKRKSFLGCMAECVIATPLNRITNAVAAKRLSKDRGMASVSHRHGASSKCGGNCAGGRFDCKRPILIQPQAHDHRSCLFLEAQFISSGVSRYLVPPPGQQN